MLQKSPRPATGNGYFFFKKKPGNNDLMVDFNYRAFPPSTGELDFWLPSTVSPHPLRGLRSFVVTFRFWGLHKNTPKKELSTELKAEISGMWGFCWLRFFGILFVKFVKPFP